MPVRLLEKLERRVWVERLIVPHQANSGKCMSECLLMHEGTSEGNSQKDNAMEYATLGNTGLLVSRFCFGTMTFGDGRGLFRAISAVGQAAADELVKTSIEGGINFFDTADNYTEGESEKILGQALKNLNIARKDIVIATKVYSRVGPGRNDIGALAATSWTASRPVSAVCRPTISTCTRSMAMIP
jgi:hypothetical protein